MDVSPNGRAPDGQKSWLRYAIEREAVARCQILLGKGADPNLPDGEGSSVLDVSGWRSLLDYLGARPELALRGWKASDLLVRSARPAALTTTIPSLASACRGQCRLRWPTA